MSTMQLHAALIWGGEPIANVLLDEPGPITIGPVAGTTFTTPDLGLPEVFSLITPGERGYLLTMGNAMGGTVSIGGTTRRVADLVGGAPFAAAPVAAGDWGVVDLDGNGSLQLFFQLAPSVEKVAPPSRAIDLDTLLPAAAFSVVLHLFLLIATFVTSTGETAFTWPGPRSLTGQFLVTRIQPPTPPVAPVMVPVVAPADPDKPAAPTQIEPPRRADKPDKGREGERGGPRIKPDAPDKPGPTRAEAGLNSPTNRDLIRKAINSPLDIDKWAKRPGTGIGRVGNGPGDGDGDELPGNPKGKDDGDGWKQQGELDTETGAHPVGGKCRGKKCGKGPGGPGGPGTEPSGEIILEPPPHIDLPPGTDLDPREIQRRIMARKGLLSTCYQREFNRNDRIGGTITPRFTIAPDGSVTSVKIEKSTVDNAAVESCVQRQIRAIKFPASTEGGVVRYPLVFNPGGR